MDLTIIDAELGMLEIDDFEISMDINIVTDPSITVNAATQEVIEVMAGLKGDPGDAGAGTSDWTGLSNIPTNISQIAGLGAVADRIPYATGPSTWALTPLTATARSLIDDTSISAMRTTLGLGTIATLTAPSGTVVGTSDVQTLTNKTISGASNTLSAIPTSAISSFQEAVEDYVAAMFANGTHSGVTVAYNDTVGSLDVSASSSTLPPVRFSASVPETGVTGDDRAYVARTIAECHLRVSAAPVGSALTCVVQRSSDRSTWTTVATLTIADGSSTLTNSVTGLAIAQSVGHYIRLNVTSVGSTTPAADPVVDVVFA